LTGQANPFFIGAMKTKTTLLSMAVWLAAGAICFASPQMGTWKLNMKKSKIGHGMTRNSTVVYSSMLFQTKVTIDGTDAKGKPFHSEWTGMFDGKDHPVTGSAMEDTRSYTKVDDRTLSFTMKKGGKVMVTGRIVVAPDGKSRTVMATGTGAKGKKVHTTAYYDKVG
jgi:hypothetical protein